MDVIQRGLLYGGQAAVAAAKTTDLINEAIALHGLSPVAAAALGRTLTAAAMLSRDLKNPDDSLTVTIRGDGPIGRIVVSTDGAARVRGYADNPGVYLPLNPAGKLDVGGAVGRGTMTVVKGMGLKKPYVGQVELVSGEIAEDFAAYFARSEQRPSAIALGVLVNPDGSCKSGGGVFVHVLPGAADNTIDDLQQRMSRLSNVSAILDGATPEQLIRDCFPDARLTERIPTEYRCKCSEASIREVLRLLGKEEAEDILRERGNVEIRCHFCGKQYSFGAEEVAEIFG